MRDFLLTQDIQDYLHRQLRAPFDPIEYFCTALLVQMKMLPHDNLGPEGVIVQMMIDFMCYAHSIEQSGSLLDLTLLDEAERVLQHRWSRVPPSTFHQMSNRLAIGSPDVCIFQGAVQFGLCRYVEKRLKTDPEMAKGRGHFVPLEAALFFPMRKEMFWDRRVNLDMLNLLLNYGASPNQYLLSRRGTVWSRFLKSMPKSMKELEKDLWVQVVEVLLTAGANTNILMTDSSGPFEFLAGVFSQQDLQRLRNAAFPDQNSPSSEECATWGWADWLCCTGKRKRRSEISEVSPTSEVSPLLHSFRAI